MQALLSYDQSPPISAPFRFFLTAPLFGIFASFLLLWSGSEVFVSRWTPAALAMTHLLTAGFMLQIMLGAMLQVMPVVAGANMPRPLQLAMLVHVAITLGALLLVAAFLSFNPMLFKASAIVFGIGISVFVGAALAAFIGVPSTSETIQGLKFALFGLSVTIALGVALAAALGWSFGVPLMQLADTHAVWGLVGWAGVLLAAVSYVVVPMFQLTPAYPQWFSRYFAGAALLALGVWTLADYAGWAQAGPLPAIAVLLVVAAYAFVTLRIQWQSKRPHMDATQWYWRIAMFSALAACALWFAALRIEAVGAWAPWQLVCGVLLLFGCFMSVMTGMLYKIVPFLIWLHLQNQGQGRAMAPNMKKYSAEPAMMRQMALHFAACGALLFAVFWPEWGVYPAALLLFVSNVLLLRNLFSALAVYRNHLLHLESLPRTS